MIIAKPVGNFWIFLCLVLTRGDRKEVNREIGWFLCSRRLWLNFEKTECKVSRIPNVRESFIVLEKLSLNIEKTWGDGRERAASRYIFPSVSRRTNSLSLPERVSILFYTNPEYSRVLKYRFLVYVILVVLWNVIISDIWEAFCDLYSRHCPFILFWARRSVIGVLF